MDVVIADRVVGESREEYLKRIIRNGKSREEAIAIQNDIREMNNGKFSVKVTEFQVFDHRTGDINADVERMLLAAKKNFVVAKIPLNSVNWEYIKNCMLVRLSFKGRMVIHQVKTEVNDRVLRTKVDFIPKELPELFKGPYIIERREEKFLFKDVVAIYGYKKDEYLYINILRYLDDGEGDIDEHNITVRIKEEELLEHKVKHLLGEYNIVDVEYDVLDKSMLVKDKEVVGIIGDGIRYVLVFGYFLQAERTPIEMSNKFREKKVDTERGKKEKFGWIERYVYLNKRYEREKREAEEELRGELNKEGKVQEEIEVNGYLRQQAYGEGRKLRKEIYVEGYSKRQWVNEGNIRYIVGDRV